MPLPWLFIVCVHLNYQQSTTKNILSVTDTQRNETISVSGKILLEQYFLSQGQKNKILVFVPNVLEGQLCYSLNLKMISRDNTGAGLNNCIFFLVDSGITEKELDLEMKTFGDEEIVTMRMEPSSPTNSSARIYLNTLSSISDYRAGSYGLLTCLYAHICTSFRNECMGMKETVYTKQKEQDKKKN